MLHLRYMRVTQIAIENKVIRESALSEKSFVKQIEGQRYFLKLFSFWLKIQLISTARGAQLFHCAEAVVKQRLCR